MSTLSAPNDFLWILFWSAAFANRGSVVVHRVARDCTGGPVVLLRSSGIADPISAPDMTTQVQLYHFLASYERGKASLEGDAGYDHSMVQRYCPNVCNEYTKGNARI